MQLFNLFKKEETREFYGRRRLLGDVVEIRVAHSSASSAEKAIKNAFLKIEELDKIFSLYNPDSDLSILNRNKEIEANTDLLYVMKKAICYSRLSNGLFDATCASCIKNVKDAISGKPIVARELELNYGLVDYNGILIKHNNIKLKKTGMSVDLGGIAKGYIADVAAKVLQENGVADGIVDARGDLRVFGSREKIIEIQHPIVKEDYMCRIKIRDGGIATSGDYNQFSYLNNKKITHILNPKTRKFDSDCSSVTIIAGNAIDADAIAKIIFLLGPNKGISYTNKLENVECFIVDKNLEVHESRNLFKYRI